MNQRGRVTVKTLPAPGWLANSTAPWCASDGPVPEIPIRTSENAHVSMLLKYGTWCYRME